MALTITVIVCAYNEAGYLGPCLQSLIQQSHQPGEIIVVDNASTDDTASIAAAVPGVRVIDEPRKGLVRARETGRVAASGQLLVYIDADCRAPGRGWHASRAVSTGSLIWSRCRGRTGSMTGTGGGVGSCARTT